MEDHEVLEAAADYITVHGWCQYRSVADNGAVCMAGGVLATLGLIELVGSHSQLTKHPDYDRYLKILRRLDKAMPAAIGFATEFNDEDGRTEEQVIDKMKSVAKDWANGN